jgi:hypothetical protein
MSEATSIEIRRIDLVARVVVACAPIMHSPTKVRDLVAESTLRMPKFAPNVAREHDIRVDRVEAHVAS